MIPLGKEIKSPVRLFKRLASGIDDVISSFSLSMNKSSLFLREDDGISTPSESNSEDSLNSSPPFELLIIEISPSFILRMEIWGWHGISPRLEKIIWVPEDGFEDRS